MHEHREWQKPLSAAPGSGRPSLLRIPLAAARPKHTPWTQHLLEECRVFVGEGDDVLARVFDDQREIALIRLLALVAGPQVLASVWGKGK